MNKLININKMFSLTAVPLPIYYSAQLVASAIFAESGEQTLRPWDCQAIARDVKGTLHAHYFLLRGCGDGPIIKRNRGFMTERKRSTAGKPVSQARSVYFRAFSLSTVGKLTFECKYIVKADSSADGVRHFLLYLYWGLFHCGVVVGVGIQI